jgi:hypothetical protein
VDLKANDDKLIQDMARFYADPLGFVMYAYPWETDASLQLVRLPEQYKVRFPDCEFGPDSWACEFLDNVGAQVKARAFDGFHPVEPIRMATVSGHGIGKSAMTGWLTNWLMSTRPDSQGTVTSNTAVQLASKTWAQIAHWTSKCITRHWFHISTGKGSMRMHHLQNPDSWKCEAQTCREENSESFAGQHAPSSTSWYIFDEASAIPDVIFTVAEGGLTDGEPHIYLFGNPTRNTGALNRAFKGALRHRWTTRQIDSRDVQITNKVQIAQWIEDYGIDSDFVKVRVRGMFPSMSAKQFIAIADVDAAFNRFLKPDQFGFAPKILTCDPAWMGDDELVIGMRQGLKFTVLRRMPKNDNDVQVATILANLEDEHLADAVFVDGGYGTGIVSAGRTMGRSHWLLVWFGSASSDPGYRNKRAEMWGLMRDWLKSGGSIPPEQELYDDLIGPEVIPRLDGVIQLESKEDMKKRGLPSPNLADALALSFAYPVTTKRWGRHGGLLINKNMAQTEYNPFDDSRGQRVTPSDYDPFKDVA